MSGLTIRDIIDLVEANRFEEALEIQRRISPAAPYLPALSRALTKALFQAERWDLAIRLLNTVAGQYPNECFFWLCLAFSLVMENREEEAKRPLDNAARLRETAADPDVDRLLDAILWRIHQTFSLDEVGRLSRWYAMFGSLDATIRRRIGGGGERRAAPSSVGIRDLSESGIGRFLEQRFQLWERGDIEPPQGAAAPSRPSPDLVGLRVMICFRRRTRAALGSRDHEAPLHYANSARDAGLTVLEHDISAFIFPQPHADDQKRSEIERLERVIAEFRPNVVLFDWPIHPFITFEDELFGPPDPVMNAEVFTRRLSNLKTRYGFCLVPVFLDVWVSQWTPAVAAAASLADAAIHYHPALSRAPGNPLAGKDVCMPGIIFSDRVLFDDGRDRDIAFAFAGSCCTYMRTFWFSQIKNRGLPIRLLSGDFDGAAVVPVSEYAQRLRRTKVSLNIGSRDRHISIITGRVLESMMSGCLLLDEQNDQMDHFFVPYVHYLPFADMDELEALVGFLSAHDEWRRKIAQAGTAWVNDRYSKVNQWRTIVATAQA